MPSSHYELGAGHHKMDCLYHFEVLLCNKKIINFLMWPNILIKWVLKEFGGLLGYFLHVFSSVKCHHNNYTQFPELIPVGPSLIFIKVTNLIILVNQVKTNCL